MARPRNAERAAIAERRTRVLAMRIEQIPYTEIAAREGIAESTARSDYRRAVEQRKQELDEQAHLNVAFEAAKLDAVEGAAWRVLRTKHITVQQGKIVGRFIGLARDDAGEVVYGPDDKPIPLYEEIEDDAPVLASIDRILKIAERRARLHGHDAPIRAKVEVTDALDADIERLVAELAGLAPGGEAPPEGAAGAGGEQAATA